MTRRHAKLLSTVDVTERGLTEKEGHHFPRTRFGTTTSAGGSGVIVTCSIMTVVFYGMRLYRLLSRKGAFDLFSQTTVEGTTVEKFFFVTVTEKGMVSTHLLLLVYFKQG